MTKEKKVGQSRRQFMKMLSAGSLACVGCAHLSGAGLEPEKKHKKPKEEKKHKFSMDSKFSFQDLFAFAFMREARLLKNMAEGLGKEKFMAELQKVSSESNAKSQKQRAKKLGKNDMEAWTLGMKKPNYFWKNVLTMEIVEDSKNVFEIKVEECLWAKTFKKAGTPEIGYARICHPDFAMAKGFNPKMRMERTKTLMQGHSHCNHRWIMES